MTSRRADELTALFERCDCPCYCAYWHFAGDKNSWLDRCANRRNDSRSELEDAARKGGPQAQGLIALTKEQVIGWMKLAPAPALSKIYAQRSYRKLPVLEPTHKAFAVGCFLVDPEFRRQGVALGLLRLAIEIARDAGASRLDAFPRIDPDLAPEHAFMGPGDIFQRLGFKETHAVGPYRVMQYAFGGS